MELECEEAGTRVFQVSTENPDATELHFTQGRLVGAVYQHDCRCNGCEGSRTQYGQPTTCTVVSRCSLCQGGAVSADCE